MRHHSSVPRPAPKAVALAAGLSLLWALSTSAAQFADVTASAGMTDVNGYCFGAAWGDYNNDGWFDLLVARNGANLLFHNNTNANHWLKVSLKGTTSNRSAIGAKVRVRANIGGRTFCATARDQQR